MTSQADVAIMTRINISVGRTYYFAAYEAKILIQSS